MRKVRTVIGAVLLSLLLLTGCKEASQPNLSLEQVILSDLIEEYRDILYTDEYRSQIDGYLVLARDGKAASEDVSRAIESVRDLKDSILNKRVTFLDKGLESLVRASLGKGEGGFLTYADVKDVTSLDLSARNGSSVSFLDDLVKFPLLKTLNLSDANITDFSPLGELTSLVSLDLSRASYSDAVQPELSCLKNLSSLEELSLEGIGVKELSFLSSMTKLKKLNIGENPITDYSGLLYCPELKELDISGGKVGNLSLVAMLSQLNALIFENGSVDSLAGIERLTSLTRLDLSGTEFGDGSLLSGLNQLTELDLSRTGLSDGNFLIGKNCTRLDLSGNHLKDATFLTTLKNLVSADLSGNELTTLTLSGMTSLMKLNLSENQLTTLNLDGDFPMLSVLDVRENRLTFLFISSASGLSELYAGQNKLSSVDFISRLPGLKTLNLDENPLKNLPSLASTKLMNLSLAGTSLSNTDFLIGLDSLVSLDLWDTKLTSLKGLAGKENLQSLRIKLNKVKKHSEFTGFPHVKDLSICGMGDEYWENFAELTELENVYITRSWITYLCLHDLNDLRTLRVTDTGTLVYTSQVYNDPVLEEYYLEGVDVYLPYISGFPLLRNLSIINGNVERLDSISDLPSCVKMDFTGNKTLSDLTFNAFPALKTLILSSCNIDNEKLKNLNVIMNLGFLDLSKNNLTKITNFVLTGDEILKLDLSGNRIKDFSPLYELEIGTVLDDGNKGHYEPPEENEPSEGL